MLVSKLMTIWRYYGLVSWPMYLAKGELGAPLKIDRHSLTSEVFVMVDDSLIKPYGLIIFKIIKSVAC